jgi:ribokinase
MKILVFGSLNIDLIFSVDHIALPGETISSASLTRSAGGKGANQAAALAKAGMPVYMAGKIGGDGEFLLDLLKSYGVNTDYVTIGGGATGQALIQVDRNGQNAIVLHAGGNGAIRLEEISRVLNNFARDDIIIVQNEINRTAEIIGAAKKQGLRICLNPSPFNEAITALPLNLVDVFFVNEIEGSALADVPPQTAPPVILDSLVKKFPAAEIILTAGRDGAYYGNGTERAQGKILDLPVADTTGAGDTFTGYFLAARAKNFPLPEALDLACKAASITVSRKGAMESIPFAEEVFS